jgi:hypothetical protein
MSLRTGITLAVVLVVGCSSAADPEASDSVASADTDDGNVIHVPSGTDNGYPTPDWAAACPASSCCVTVGRDFSSKLFEQRLDAWGCTAEPGVQNGLDSKAYAQNWILDAQHWWFFTYCPDTLGGVDYVKRTVMPGPLTDWVRNDHDDSPRGWSDVAPIWSGYLRDIGCIPPAPTGYSIVSWDPTCDTGCKITVW